MMHDTIGKTDTMEEIRMAFRFGLLEQLKVKKVYSVESVLEFIITFFKKINDRGVNNFFC